jgi:hypothetical protein
MPTSKPEPLATDKIADEVAAISEAVKRLRAGKLNDKALLLLISHASGQSQSTVRAVLDGMEGMRAYYLKKNAQ